MKLRLKSISKRVLIVAAIYFNLFNILSYINPRLTSTFYPLKTINNGSVVIRTAEAKNKADSVPVPKPAITLTSLEKVNQLISSGVIEVNSSGQREIASGRLSTNLIKALAFTGEIAKDNNQKVKISCFINGNSFKQHRAGQAFDIANEGIAELILPAIYQNKNNLGIKEIIYSNGRYNLYNGAPHRYNSGTLRAHADHIHIATY